MKKKSQSVYACTVEYNDTLDMLKKMLLLYAAVINAKKGETHLRPRMSQVLAFYILLGYSSETKDMITESLGITKTNLNQINSDLTKRGYLLRDMRNYTKRHLSEDIQLLKNHFLEGKGKKLFLVNLTDVKT